MRRVVQSNTIDELHGKSQKLEQEQEELNLQIKLLIDFGDDAADAAEGLVEAIDEAGLKEPEPDQETVVPSHVRRKKKKRRNEGLPEHLPRYEVEAEVSDDDKHCEEHGERKVIGYDRVETLELERPKLRVRVTKHPKQQSRNFCRITNPDSSLEYFGRVGLRDSPLARVHQASPTSWPKLATIGSGIFTMVR